MTTPTPSVTSQTTPEVTPSVTTPPITETTPTVTTGIVYTVKAPDYFAFLPHCKRASLRLCKFKSIIEMFVLI